MESKVKVTVKKVLDTAQEEAVICAVELTEQVRTAAALLENGEQTIIGIKDGEKIPCPISKIYYVESVDEKSFAYLKEDCFELPYKLYELEQILGYRFFRCSKSMICNSRKIKSVKAVENAKMNATLLNGEMIVISRSYVKELKKRLGI